MMLGLTEPTSGSVKVCGIDSTKEPLEVKKRVGYLPDNLGFYENWSGVDNLLYIARLNRIPETEGKRRAEELLEKVGLGDVKEKKTGKYSRGMRQRLGLADVLIKNPQIIILDEPTLGIDPSGVREFLELIVQLSKQEGLTVLLSSHHLHQVQQVCDRVGIFVEGKLLAEGNIHTLSQKLFRGEAFAVEIGVETKQDTAKKINKKRNFPEELETIFQKIEGINTVQYQDGMFHLGCSLDITSTVARAVMQEGFALTHLSKKEYGLDDIYHRYFKGGKL